MEIFNYGCLVMAVFSQTRHKTHTHTHKLLKIQMGCISRVPYESSAQSSVSLRHDNHWIPELVVQDFGFLLWSTFMLLTLMLKDETVGSSETLVFMYTG
jgi:hypothetical protein